MKLLEGKSMVLLFAVMTLSFGASILRPQLIEGDIVFDQKLKKIIKQANDNFQGTRSKRNVFTAMKKVHEHKWKDGFIPYVLSTELDESARIAIEKAFTEIEKFTCVQFSPWKQEDDFVEFIKGDGCYSSIGRQKGRQVVSIGEGCEFKKTVIHELMHVLGMFHEQTRLDRDLYVNVLWWNLQTDAKKNFYTYDHGVINSLEFPYDYKSSTHYFNKEFSKNGHDTLQAVGSSSKTLGNTIGMSKIDIKKIWKFYRCYTTKHRPQKEKCTDVMDWCHHYTRHCDTKWFAEKYCQKSCKTCIER